VFFLALSCLQGRPMRSAFDELSALGTGLQLTPGNEPSAGFEAAVLASGVPVRTHHGFSFTHRSAQVWAGTGELRVTSHSVHPPKVGTPAALAFDAFLERHTGQVLETMYPGYRLGTGPELERAMALGVPLAVDVSHLFMQRQAEVLSEQTCRRVFSYCNIHEVHVSANDGRHDSHRPLNADSFGLGWAREQGRAGVPIVYEGYLHQVSEPQRRAQVELARSALT
jgi:hypothetical protein